MDDIRKETDSQLGHRDAPEPFLVDYVIVLFKRKKTVVVFTLLAGLLALAYTRMVPDTFTATARLLVPQKADPGISGLLAKMQGSAVGSLLGSAAASDIYVGILESRSVADRIIQRFGLRDRYGEPSLEDTREKLKKRTKITSGEDQILHISVKDPSPRQASEMANAYAEELDRINQTVSITEGHLKRVFLEKRLAKVKDELLNAEGRLKEFQETYRLVALEEQARVTIEGAARIKGEIIVAQTELEVFKKFGTERNSEAVRLKSRIAELTRQLEKIEEGNTHTGVLKNAVAVDRTESNFYIPFNELPALGMQLVRLTREAKIQEEVFKLVTSQYELAKIEEARDINTIQTLDPAVPPDRKSGPNRALIVVLAAACGLFAGVLAAFYREFMEHLRTDYPDRYAKFVRHSPLHRSKKIIPAVQN